MQTAINFVQKVTDEIVNPLIFLLISLSLAWFLWGVAKYVLNADNETARKEGTQGMIWGILGLVIMTSVFAIIRLLLSTFSIDVPDAFSS